MSQRNPNIGHIVIRICYGRSLWAVLEAEVVCCLFANFSQHTGTEMYNLKTPASSVCNNRGDASGTFVTSPTAFIHMKSVYNRWGFLICAVFTAWKEAIVVGKHFQSGEFSYDMQHINPSVSNFISFWTHCRRRLAESILAVMGQRSLVQRSGMQPTSQILLLLYGRVEA